MEKEVETLKKQINNDISKAIEAIFRVRDNKGRLHDYKLVPAHRKLIKTGLLGDRSVLTRIIDKGRQGGFSNFVAVECLMIAQLMPNTYQYYIATKEDQAKKWLRDRVFQLAKDARLNFDGSRFININTRRSTQTQIVVDHIFPRNRDMEFSYITGLAAAPESIQGPTALNVIMDEMPKMKTKVNQQRDTYDAVAYFITQGGQLTMQGIPDVKSDLFWKIYSHPKQFGATPFYFPIIENWKDINLRKPLYHLSRDAMSKGDEKWYELWKNVRIEDKIVKEAWVQKMKIPYFWWDIGELEKKRAGDLDYFKQWVLGIPYDVAFRFITPELLYPRVKSEEKMFPTLGRIVKMGIDVGQERDITAITVGEMDENGVMWEIWVEEHQEHYPIQAEAIYELCQRYKPLEVIIDNTGIGRGLADILEAKGVPIRRVEFASTVKLEDRSMRMTEYLAMGFKRKLIQNKYFLIENPYAIHHVLGVQRLETASKQIRYSGKQSEAKRDDYFWSKGLLAADFEFQNIIPAFVAEPLENRGKRAIPLSANVGGYPFGGDLEVITW